MPRSDRLTQQNQSTKRNSAPSPRSSPLPGHFVNPHALHSRQRECSRSTFCSHQPQASPEQRELLGIWDGGPVPWMLPYVDFAALHMHWKSAGHQAHYLHRHIIPSDTSFSYIYIYIHMSSYLYMAHIRCLFPHFPKVVRDL